MSATIQLTANTTITGNGSINMSIYVVLSDMEQILIDVPILESNWNNGTWQTQQVGSKRVRLERLNYSNNSNTHVTLTSLEVRGFCKDGSLRVRSEHLYSHSLTKEVIAQIPDEYHNYARNFFSEKTKELQNTLNLIVAKGVTVEAHN